MAEEKLIRFAGVCCVYDDDRWLPLMLESVLGELSRLFVLVSDRPWHGEPADNRATLECLRDFSDPRKKIELIQGSWTSETEQRQAGLRLVEQAGFDYCFIVDADEVYDPLVLRHMQQTAVNHPQVGCWYMTCLTYWKTHRYRIDPPEAYKPPVFLRVGKCTLGERRWATAPVTAAFPPEIGVCHHLSYARTNEELLKKITTFSHAAEVVPGWYEKVWLAWDRNHDLENLHPVYPATYKRAVVQLREALPPVLRRLE